MAGRTDYSEPGALVLGYACCLDARDWAGYRALFTDTVILDYAAIGSLVGPIAADEWTMRCRSLEGFDATLHRISNLRVAVDGRTATVDSYVDALHFLNDRGQDHIAQVAGTYRHDLQSEGGRWRISGCALKVAGFPSGRAAFDHAFTLARARFSGARQ